MAISITIDSTRAVGNKREVRGTGNLGTGYAAGGVAVAASDFGLSKLDNLDVFPGGADAGTAAVALRYDSTNGKIQAYEQTDTATVPLIEDATADLSTFIFHYVATGV